MLAFLGLSEWGRVLGPFPVPELITLGFPGSRPGVSSHCHSLRLAEVSASISDLLGPLLALYCLHSLTWDRKPIKKKTAVRVCATYLDISKLIGGQELQL